MNLTWHIEKDGAITLRDENSAPRVHVGRGDDGWVVTVLEAGLPSCGPHDGPRSAFEWAEWYVKHRVFLDAQFGQRPVLKIEHVFPNPKLKEVA